jgi:UPF0755 protein
MSGGRRASALVVAAAVAGVLVGVAILLGWSALNEAPPAAPAEEPIAFRVEPGEGFARVARRLEETGLVVSSTRLLILARLTGSDRSIRTGTYEFRRGTPPRDLIDDLVAGRVRLLRFTVPEGWRLMQIAAAAESTLGITAGEFLAAARDSARRAALGCPAESLEGYLFPETYLFADPTTAAEVVDRMTERFEEVWASLHGESPLDLDRHAVVTLASIVEAETPKPDERARVAAVYLNRLARGWRLEADPTVRYGLGHFTGRLYYHHLDVDTPYNTYQRSGLPPGPIGAPGRAALVAVREPLSPCDDFFFVASGDGGHVFSRTKAEHDRARRAAGR